MLNNSVISLISKGFVDKATNGIELRLLSILSLLIDAIIEERTVQYRTDHGCTAFAKKMQKSFRSLLKCRKHNASDFTFIIVLE